MLATAALFVFGGCRARETAPAREAVSTSTSPSTSTPGPAPSGGRELALAHCSGCHLFPEPGLYDRVTWREKVLPLMGPRLGIFEWQGREYPNERADPELAAASVYPSSPLLPGADWQRILDWYDAQAPDSVEGPPPPEPIRPVSARFVARFGAKGATPAMTTLVKLDLATGDLFVGDGMANTLTVLDRGLRLRAAYQLASPPIHLRFDLGRGPDARGLWTLEMGSMRPTNARTGKLHHAFLRPDATLHGAQRAVLDALQRPVHAAFGDLDRDGAEDVVVAEFGWITGSLSWYGRGPAGPAVRHVLAPRPGAITSVVRDFDGDGLTDVVALMAQGDEGVFLHRALPGGGFREEALLRFPPSCGSSALEVLDFDGDGDLDVVHACGDNADGMNVLKGYHGVRVFTGDGNGRLAEAFFFRMNGAYGVRARDFDLDGDVDIAAVSFFPDHERRPSEGFVLLENQGGWRFEASSFEGVESGRWMVMDAGDRDGDGDVDLVLGSFVLGPSLVPEPLQQRWIREGPPFVILDNATR